MNQKHKKISSRALPKIVDRKWLVADHTDCEDCEEELLFLMCDQEHEFSLGLSVVLNCLSIAEEEGFVPQLPNDWWGQLRTF
ncbi:hypothetical protein [Levilactobacillus brevis]|uniref:hypothetical protein n=1 Tax=Levilactobacillus brevis TaxID=1580 RepID=UPI001165AA0C|nr:hypothetical protein [Levilactobacillus brevis]QCZ44822.1 hypothetical protein UCCLBBS124_pA0024 [Levilactobacillus brevis]